jgi:hypothetical protein
MVQERIPNASILKDSGMEGAISFKYKDLKFILTSDGEGQLGLIPDLTNATIQDRPSYFEIVPELYQYLKAPTKKEAEEISKKIKTTATKLPKKKLKLESTLSESSTIDNLKKRFKSFPKGPLSLEQIEAVVKLYKEVDKLSDDIFENPDKYDYKDFEGASDLGNEIEEYMIGMNDWLTVDALGAKRIIHKHLDNITAESITADWSIGKDSAKKEIERIKKESPKLPKKKLKLEDTI